MPSVLYKVQTVIGDNLVQSVIADGFHEYDQVFRDVDEAEYSHTFVVYAFLAGDSDKARTQHRLRVDYCRELWLFRSGVARPLPAASRGGN